MIKTRQQGVTSVWTVVAITSIILFFIVSAVAVWAYSEYSKEKRNVDERISSAVAEGRREQMEIEQKKYTEESKNPRQEFVGPEDYGRVSFYYPKTWSVFVERDASDRGNFQAYFHPEVIPPITNRDSRYALKLEILNRDYDSVLNQYQALLKKGDLASSTPEFNGLPSTRIDGAFSKELRGSVVLFRVRDKTVRLSTEAETFRPDFESVLETIKMSL